jgi:hypothetical protein
MFCYDTIDRTEESRKANIFAAQGFSPDKFLPAQYPKLEGLKVKKVSGRGNSSANFFMCYFRLG